MRSQFKYLPVLECWKKNQNYDAKSRSEHCIIKEFLFHNSQWDRFEWNFNNKMATKMLYTVREGSEKLVEKTFERLNRRHACLFYG